MFPPPNDTSSDLLLVMAARDNLITSTDFSESTNISETKQSGISSSEGLKSINVNTTTHSMIMTTAHKRSSKDFIFGKVIGEGSFSMVYLGKDIHTNKEYAIKVCEKRHIIKERKSEYIKREKEVLNMLSGAKHSFVRLYCTFQDIERLYFVLSYAKNGELLPYINKVGSFDIECTRFYAAEILYGLEFLHGLGIIHRDLKPENILLDENMHILITDFGSAKILCEDSEIKKADSNNEHKRRNSFVGTAQYVSPELLTDKTTSKASDLWALGCIIYQMVAGLPPFRSRSEYLIFQQILKLEYEIPNGFCDLAKDLVKKLLILEPKQRIGATDEHGYPSIRSHPFFVNVHFETLHDQIPPPIYPYLPGTSEHEELRSQYRVPDNLKPGLDDKQLTRLLGLGIMEMNNKNEESSSSIEQQQILSLSLQEQQKQHQKGGENELNKYEQRQNLRQQEFRKIKRKITITDLNADEIKNRLEQQRVNPWNSFVEGNLIIKEGLVNKRKGLFARRRMLLLTTGPHLYYVDPTHMILKGEIPWSMELRVEPKNFKIFFVHTPNRTYYLEESEGYALEWCQAIEDIRIHYYGIKESS